MRAKIAVSPPRGLESWRPTRIYSKYRRIGNVMIREQLTGKRLRIIQDFLGTFPELDVGAGKSRKARLALDIKASSRPDIVADAQFIPLKDEAVDSLACSHVIEHIRKVEVVLSEITRILRKGGTSIFFVPNDESKIWKVIEPFWTIYYEKMVSALDSPRTHVHSFSKEKLGHLLDGYFDLTEVGKINAGMEIYAICLKRAGA